MVLSTTPTRHHLAKSTSGILAAADRAEPKIRRAMLAALDKLQAAVPDLESLIAAGKLDAVISAVTGQSLPPELLGAIRDATMTAAIQSAETGGFKVAFNDVNEALEAADIAPTEADIVMVPSNMVKLDGKKAEQCIKLLTIIDDHDDVQKVSANLDFDESEIS